jgi:hypothetical protein
LQYVAVPISGSAFVEPGMQYAIVVSLSGAAEDAAIQWYSCAANVYTGGSMLINEGSGWSSQPADAMFQTYVIPDKLNLSETGDDQQISFGPPPAQGSAAQSFTPTLSGALDRVGLGLMEVDGIDTGPVQVSIQTTVNGLPSGIEIGHGQIPANTLSIFNGSWADAEINPDSTAAVRVTAGTPYAIVVTECCGQFYWASSSQNKGDMLYNDGSGWTSEGGGAMFQTYVATPVLSVAAPPPGGITPCSYGVCPAAAAWITPKDSTARVSSAVNLHERRDGKVDGFLDFNNSRTGNFVLQGFVSEWAAWQLSVTTFACTDQHAITVIGAYTPKGGTSTDYQLSLSGVRDGIGTFTLTAGDYTYSLSRSGIVDVRCPPVAPR